MADIFDLSDVWNDGATTFTGIGLDVTDTASASGSLLMDLQVGGSSKFQVSKDGMISVRTGAYNDLGLRFGYTGTNGMYFNSNQLSVQISSAAIAHVSIADGVAAQLFSFRGAGSTTDLSLYRDAADTLAQRRSTNPQAFRVYNSYTDGSNYEHLAFAFVSNIARMETQQAGTGSSRILLLRGSQLFLRVGASGNGIGWQINDSGHFQTSTDNSYDIGGATANRPRNIHQSGYIQTSEMTAPAAPAANGVRIYAEDDGSGKTRLMALFATGAAQQIAIEP